MAKKGKARPQYVPHPRYGAAPLPSGYSFSLEEIQSSYWGYQSNAKSIVLGTAIPADTSKQNYSTYPRTLYVDQIRKCRDCARFFIFFAKEQQHWYEDLGFYIDVDCVHCPECRKDRQALKRYSNLAGKDLSSSEEILAFADLTLTLLRAGMLKRPAKLFAALTKLAVLGDFAETITEIKKSIRDYQTSD